MSRFMCQLDIELLVDKDGLPILSKAGEQLWRLTSPLGYMSDRVKTTIMVPAEFITDFASVPRLPFIYASLGNIAQMPAVIHDFLYKTKPYSRKVCDEVLLEAMEVIRIPWLKRKLIFWGVRIGGGAFYGR